MITPRPSDCVESVYVGDKIHFLGLDRQTTQDAAFDYARDYPLDYHVVVSYKGKNEYEQHDYEVTVTKGVLSA